MTFGVGAAAQTGLTMKAVSTDPGRVNGRIQVIDKLVAVASSADDLVVTLLRLGARRR